MPSVAVASPFGNDPTPIFYRDSHEGQRAPIVLHLHGGWGYEVYSCQRQIDALSDVRFIIPDRSGYGRSPRIDELPRKFHLAAAVETEHTIRALGLERPILWGHSDGAVIAAIMALRKPDQYAGIVLEALHVDRLKPRSREFFLQMASAPETFGERVVALLRADHAERWQHVLQMGGRAWLEIAARANAYDFYDHRLADLATPTCVIHGADDPRTEPDEIDRIRTALAHAEIHVLAGGGHCPHAERRVGDQVTEILRAFIDARA